MQKWMIEWMNVHCDLEKEKQIETSIFLSFSVARVQHFSILGCIWNMLMLSSGVTMHILCEIQNWKWKTFCIGHNKLVIKPKRKPNSDLKARWWKKRRNDYTPKITKHDNNKSAWAAFPYLSKRFNIFAQIDFQLNTKWCWILYCIFCCGAPIGLFKLINRAVRAERDLKNLQA